MSLNVKYLFWWIPVFLVIGCSAVSCDFGVFVRGRRAQVLLLCHLSQNRGAAFSLGSGWLFPQHVPATVPSIRAVEMPGPCTLLERWVGAMLGACSQGSGRQLLSAHSWDRRGSAWRLLCFVFQRHQCWQRNRRSACTGADVNSGLHETRMDRTRRKCLEVIQGDFCRKNHLHFAF